LLKIKNGNMENKKSLLWLDDLRNPFLDEEKRLPKGNGEWDISWVLNCEQFIKWVELHGPPDAVSFDHDLAEEHYTPEYFWGDYEESKKFQEWKSKSYKEQTGEGCAKWLKETCELWNLDLPHIFIHSANPVGADKIVEVFGGIQGIGELRKKQKNNLLWQQFIK
tara:strand:+ start:208 stop:702 length:495 start_codon:yes stop_codon:yes gene_type:complete